MKAQFDLVIGENKFTLIEDVENNADFFKKFAFYQSLPKVGPNGETDLVLTYRIAQKQYEYYSIVSKKANQEFKFGQSKEAKGQLFGKGWEPLYKSDESEEGTQTEGTATGLGAASPASAPASIHTGLGAPTPAPAAAAPPKAQTPPEASPKVAAQAANVLSRFGI